VSVETGIAPQALLDAPAGMLEAIIDVLQKRAEESRQAMKR